jgi:hypothetical protein
MNKATGSTLRPKLGNTFFLQQRGTALDRKQIWIWIAPDKWRFCSFCSTRFAVECQICSDQAYAETGDRSRIAFIDCFSSSPLCGERSRSKSKTGIDPTAGLIRPAPATGRVDVLGSWQGSRSASARVNFMRRKLWGRETIQRSARLIVLRLPFADELWDVGRIFLETSDIRRNCPRLRSTDPDLRDRRHHLRVIQRPGPYVYDFGIGKHFCMGAGKALRTNVLPMHCPTASGSLPPKCFA